MTTATEWLNDNPDSLAKLTSMLGDAGMPATVFTELPESLQRSIMDNLRESFSQDYWDSIATTTGGDAATILERGLQEGQSIRAMAEQLKESLGGDDYARTRAFNIARTESGNALNGARRATMDQLAADLGPQVPMKPTWLSVLGNTTRNEHANRDGVPADRDGLWDLAGYRIPWPGHFSLPAGQRCNCQCSIFTEFGMQDAEAMELIGQYYDRVIEEEKVLKFNPYHDAEGRFAPSSGAEGAGSGGGSSGEDKNSFDFGAGKVPAHRHKNPDGTVGGWVADTAEVGGDIYIGSNARVKDNAKITSYGTKEPIKILDNAIVSGNARVYGNRQFNFPVIISGNASISDSARITGGLISGNAVVDGRAMVGHKAVVMGKVTDDAVVMNYGYVPDGVTIGGSTLYTADKHTQGNSKLEIYLGTKGYRTNSNSVDDPEHISAEIIHKVGAAKSVGDGMKSLVSDDDLESLHKSGYLAKVEEQTTIAKGSTIHDQVAASLIHNWAKTSGDHNPMAIAIQQSANRQLGLKDAADPTTVYKSDDKVLTSTKDIESKHGKVIDAFVRATYENTQKQLKEAGVEELILYRGVKHNLGVDTKEVQLNPMSSFTTNFHIAASFAGMGPVMAIKVKAKDIFSTYSSGSGCRDESEVVVLGGVKRLERLASGNETLNPDAFWGASPETKFFTDLKTTTTKLINQVFDPKERKPTNAGRNS
jgi:carbonic anhydrase/acetyltransferase-like protein (isoleucine patch superfamily)